MFYNSLQSATAALDKIAARAGRAAERGRARGPGCRCRHRCAAGCRCRRSRSPTAPTGRCCRARPRHPGRPDRRAGRGHRRGQDDHRQADLALLRPDQSGRCASTASTCATSPTPSCARRRDDHAGRLPVLRLGRRQHRLRPARRDRATRSSRRPGRSARTSSSPRCPTGYDTDVRKRGGRLSAGQRQLVAFARAFLADPAVLILDEATSSLDVPTERAVQRALRTVLAQRTALIIAHRLSTVEIADRVLVLRGRRAWSRTARPSRWSPPARATSPRCTTSWRDSLV